KASALRPSPAENFLAVTLPQLMKRQPVETAAAHHRLLLLAVHDLPGLAVGGRVGQLAAIDAFQLAAAPDALHVERFENDRFHAAEHAPPRGGGKAPDVHLGKQPRAYSGFADFSPSENGLARMAASGDARGGFQNGEN